MKKKQSRRMSRAALTALGIPAVLIPGILLAMALGWNPMVLTQTDTYQKIERIFPTNGTVSTVIDGDTFTLQNGVDVRMLGIDAPARGEEGYTQASDALAAFIKGKRVYLEYDRYQDDKYGRVLAWIWVDCEKKPQFLPADYMHLSGNASREGLIENPSGCKEGNLINEAMVKVGVAKLQQYTDRGELKYEKRLHTE